MRFCHFRRFCSASVICHTCRFHHACAIGLILLIAIPGTPRAQGHFTTPTYTPRFSPVYHPMQFNGYYGTVSIRHKFKIVFMDGTDTIVYSTIHADTPSYYLLLENKSVKKKDSARFRKVFPSQTKNIIRLDKYSVSRDKYEDFESNGMSTDSCWLFKAIDGKICAYTPLAEDDVDDGFLRYIQKDGGPLVEINSENLQQMVDKDEKASHLAERKKYTKSINTFNKSAN
jgi:hypothetical protein